VAGDAGALARKAALMLNAGEGARAPSIEGLVTSKIETDASTGGLASPTPPELLIATYEEGKSIS
jgi:hypothetical protein